MVSATTECKVKILEKAPKDRTNNKRNPLFLLPPSFPHSLPPSLPPSLPTYLSE